MVEAFRNLDRDQWGLIPVAQLDSYKGLIFATFDPEAPTLPDYLGDMAWYLDILVGPPRRRHGSKRAAPLGGRRQLENRRGKFRRRRLSYRSTHGSARELGIDTTTSKTRQWNKGCQIACGNGHVLVAWICPPDERAMVRPAG